MLQVVDSNPTMIRGFLSPCVDPMYQAIKLIRQMPGYHKYGNAHYPRSDLIQIIIIVAILILFQVSVVFGDNMMKVFLNSLSSDETYLYKAARELVSASGNACEHLNTSCQMHINYAVG